MCGLGREYICVDGFLLRLCEMICRDMDRGGVSAFESRRDGDVCSAGFQPWVKWIGDESPVGTDMSVFIICEYSKRSFSSALLGTI